MRSSDVHIEDPCHESWDAMAGDGARRHCSACDKHVHDLSAMRHDEATALLASRRDAPLCIRYTAEADGTLRFRDLVPALSLTRRLVRAAFAATMLAACTPHGEPALGDAVIEVIQDGAVPSPDGGCDYATGPLTSFHFAPGSRFCSGAGQDAAESAPPPTRSDGAPTDTPAVPPTVAPRPEPGPRMGQERAVPAAKDPFVPCDPEPVVTPTPRPGGKKLMGKPALPRRDVPASAPVPPAMPDPPLEKMGKRKRPID